MKTPPIYKLIFLNKNIEKKIISEYWEVDNEFIGWKNNLSEIAKTNNTSMAYISSIVKENSRFELYCTECKNLIDKYNLRGGLNWFDFVCGTEIRCKKCFSKPQVNIVTKTVIKEIEPALKSAKKMNIAFDTKQWLNLNQTELEVLIKVAESKSKSEVYTKVFPDVNLRSQYNEFYWSILNHLDDLNLIWIERDDDNSIIQFHKHGNLYKTLLNDFPDLVMKRKEPNPQKKYGFTLQKNDDKQEKEPDYIGDFKIKSDIVLKKDTVLKCAIWHNKIDGLYVRIKDA